MSLSTDIKEQLLSHRKATEAFQNLNKGTQLTLAEFCRCTQWGKEGKEQFINALKKMTPIGKVVIEMQNLKE